MEFVEVNASSEYFAVVKHQFETVIKPIYGTQQRLYDELEKSSAERKCLLLLDSKEPVGILVFKTSITDGRTDSKYTAGCFILKTLFVIDGNSGKGYGSALMNKVIEEASIRHATSIYATVSESIPEALAFFEKKGFKKVREMKDKFKTGVTEYVMNKTLE